MKESDRNSLQSLRDMEVEENLEIQHARLLHPLQTGSAISRFTKKIQTTAYLYR